MDLIFVAAILTAGLLFIILGLSVLLYIVPVRSIVGISISRTGVSRTSVRASWLFAGIRLLQEESEGSVSFLFGSRAVYTIAFAGREGPDEVPERHEAGVEPGALALPQGRIARIGQRLVGPISSLGSVIWQESRFTELRGRVIVGFGDPVLTGEFFGYYWACRFILEAFRVYIEVEPDFEREVFACDLEARMSLAHPLLVILAALRLALHPAIRELATTFTSRTPGGAPA